MKLRDIFETHRGYEADFKKVDFIGDEDGLLPFNVTVTYDYEPESYSDHPYGQGYARESHPPVINIERIVANEQVEQRDDKDEVIRTWPKGTDVKKLPGWNEKHLDWFTQEISERDH